MQIRGGHGPLGLVFMRERVIQLDGEFTIDAKEGEGTPYPGGNPHIEPALKWHRTDVPVPRGLKRPKKL